MSRASSVERLKRDFASICYFASHANSKVNNTGVKIGKCTQKIIYMWLAIDQIVFRILYPNKT